MSELLTAKQLQEILRVDRATIYRMAESGRLPALKVGSQWRFSRPQIEAWLELQGQQGVAAATGDKISAEPARSPIDVKALFAMECVQLIQDAFADLLGVMMLVVDLDGQPLTRPSNACGLHLALRSTAHAHERCLAQWQQMAGDPSLAPRFYVNPLGLLCARALVRIGADIGAMLVLGDIAPENWPPAEAAIREMASGLGVDPVLLAAHVHEVHRLDPTGQERALNYAQRVADIFAHIGAERATLYSRLQLIAEITQI